MKPLDIRIVELIEALNQAGVDPAQASVKQLVEGLLPPTDKQVSRHDLTDEQMQHYLDLYKTGETVKPGGGKTTPWKPSEMATPGWDEQAEPISSKSQMERGTEPFKVGDKVLWIPGWEVKQGTIHSLSSLDPLKLPVKVEGEDPPYMVAVNRLHRVDNNPPPPIESRKDSRGRTFKSGDKVWYWDTKMEARVHGTITGFRDYEGGEGAWRHCYQSCKKAVLKANSISPLNHPDVMSVTRYPELDRLHHDCGDIVNECGGLPGLRLKLGTWVKWYQESWPRDPHGVLIGFQPKTGRYHNLMALVYLDGIVKYVKPASLIVVSDEDDDGDEDEQTLSYQWQSGDKATPGRDEQAELQMERGTEPFKPQPCRLNRGSLK